MEGSNNWIAIGDPVTLSASNNWAYEWKNLPVQPEGGGKVESYRVTEPDLPQGYVQLPYKEVRPDNPNESPYTIKFTLTNVETTSFTVTKEWNRNADDPTPEEVTVGLYRTTVQSVVGSTEGEGVEAVRVTESDLSSDPLTANLPDDDGIWSHTFTGLPKYNEEGTPYLYYALELDADGDPVADNGSITFTGVGDFHVDYNHTASAENQESQSTTITNTTATSLSGTKTWKDNSNKYGTRPDDLTLNLYRTTVTSSGEDDWGKPLALAAEGIELTITDNGDNTWTYTFDNLPKYAPGGEEYTYKVEEVVPNNYAEEKGGIGGEANEDPTTDTLSGPNFINTLTDTLEINGTKVWDAATIGTTPTLKLERKADGEENWETVDADPNWSTGSAVWTYQYTNLDMYDEQQRRYTYRVTETKQDGYDVYYEDADGVLNENITNVQRGWLQVGKEVTGRRGNHSYAFGFSVTFTLPTNFSTVDNSWPIITWTKSDGETANVAFTGNTLTIPFTLSDDETIMFTGLPGNTTYTVTETDSYGHTSSATGDVGTIPPGNMAQAEFNNYRGGGGGGSTPDPEEPPVDIPDDPTPGDNVPPDDPDTPEEPPVDIPDDPIPGEDVPPDEPDNPDDSGTDIPDDPVPGGNVQPNKPNTSEQPGKPGLPQTGQLWWPVLLLAAVGAVMSLVGLWNIKRYRGKHGKN